MLKRMCSQPPCMNIDVISVSSARRGARIAARSTVLAMRLGVGGGALADQLLLCDGAVGVEPFALLARVRDPVGDEPVLEQRLGRHLVGLPERERRALEEQEHEHVDHDDRQRDHREVVVLDVVAKRDHPRPQSQDARGASRAGLSAVSATGCARRSGPARRRGTNCAPAGRRRPTRSPARRPWPPAGELVRVPVAHDRQMLLGRAQVLADGQHRDVVLAQLGRSRTSPPSSPPARPSSPTW